MWLLIGYTAVGFTEEWKESDLWQATLKYRPSCLTFNIFKKMFLL